VKQHGQCEAVLTVNRVMVTNNQRFSQNKFFLVLVINLTQFHLTTATVE